MAINDWLADELSLSTLGWNVSVTSLSTPEKRGEHLVVPQRSGVIPRFNRSVSASEFSLTMWVIGCTSTGSIPATGTLRRQQFDLNLNNILRIFAKDSRPIVFKHVTPASTNKVASALMTSTIEVETMMARQRGQFQATFQVLDGYWRDENTTTDAGVAGATMPKSVALTNLSGGTAPIEDAVLTVTGPATAPVWIQDLETGTWVQYAGGLSAGQTWTVDAGLYTSVVSGVGSVQSSTGHGGHARFMYIPPRYGQTSVPMLQLGGGGGGGSTTNLSVTAYRKYLVP